MSAAGNSRNISEDEVRVKEFLIQEIKNHPNMWGRQGSGVSGKPAGAKSMSEEWQAILNNMWEAFKSTPELLARCKVDTVPGMKNAWQCLREAHRRKWSNEIEKNDSVGKLERTVLPVPNSN